MPQDAIVCYQRALQARPDYAMAFGEALSCVWSRPVYCAKMNIVCDSAYFYDASLITSDCFNLVIP